jgi:L-asparaginase
MSLDFIDAAIRGGAQGIVVGRRRRGQHERERDRRARQSGARGVVVVRSSRVVRRWYCAITRSTTTGSASSQPATSIRRKSRVLLQLALTRTRDPRRSRPSST